MTTAFTEVSRDYDDLWLLTRDYRGWMLKKLLNHLNMQADSRFADLGGGTGIFTHLLSQAVPLESEAICVDPSGAMLLNAEQYSGIQTRCASAEAFIDSGVQLDRVLIKESIHHIRNRERFWKKMRSCLRPNGRVLVVTRPSLPEFPLFSRAMTAFSESQPELDILLGEIAASGLGAVTSREEYRVEIPKDRWDAMLRARFMSNLAGFTSDEIEKGILEIDDQLDGDQIRFIDHLLFVLVERESDMPSGQAKASPAAK